MTSQEYIAKAGDDLRDALFAIAMNEEQHPAVQAVAALKDDPLALARELLNGKYRTRRGRPRKPAQTETTGG